MSKKLTVKQGFHDGIPIFLGYLSVAVAFGMISIKNGLPIWAPTLISLTNFTGTGQFVGADLIAKLSGIPEIIFTLLIINARYILMSLSLSQRLSDKVTLWQRFIIAFGNTDEIFAVSMGRGQKLNFQYMLGLILCSFSGWVGGTILGSAVTGAIPPTVTSALGIALYAMFLAIIVPPARESGPITKVVIIAIVFSCAFKFVPVLCNLSSGWAVIISGVVSSAAGAVLFPMEVEEYNE